MQPFRTRPSPSEPEQTGEAAALEEDGTGGCDGLKPSADVMRADRAGEGIGGDGLPRGQAANTGACLALTSPGERGQGQGSRPRGRGVLWVPVDRGKRKEEIAEGVWWWVGSRRETQGK